MSIYDHIIDGIRHKKSGSSKIEPYLESLKPDVRMLRGAYRKYPVFIPYNKESVQSAYLITYLPHYYQLIEKVLREQNPDSLSNRTSVNITFIGGGPGSEVYGAIKHILSHNSGVETINVSILDINADSWGYSHQIVLQNLIYQLPNIKKVNIIWNAYKMNLVEYSTVVSQLEIYTNSDLVVVQNCINEIASKNYTELLRAMKFIFNNIPPRGALLMIDLTSSVRSMIGKIEVELKELPGVNEVSGTMMQRHPSKMVSINSRPSEIIKKYLLDYSDGLIPRKNLNYDYSYVSKCFVRANRRNQSTTGLAALYEPLQNLNVEEAKNRTFIGFDFGTSISVCTVSYVEQGELKLKSIDFEQKGPHGKINRSPLLPSVLGVASKQFMVGQHAYDLKAELEYGKNIWYGFKDQLGFLEVIKYQNSILKDYPKARISNAKEGLIVYFKYIKEKIDIYIKKNQLPSDIYFSISIPANYSDKRKAELRKCLQLSGIDYQESSFVFEPVSSLIYALYNEDIILSKIIGRQNILVLDIGAGTLDVSILAINYDNDEIGAEILAVERIDEVGGKKVDELILNHFNIGLGDINNKKILHYCEKLKIVMCKSIVMDNQNILPELATSNSKRTIDELVLSYQQLNSIMDEYWAMVLKTIVKALKISNLQVSDINDVILSGGGARNPYIRSKVRLFFSSSNLIRPDNIQEQAARGNALLSFVQNSFGKNLINTQLPYSIILKGKRNNRLLFKKGCETPSLDKEILADDLFNNQLILEKEGFEEEVLFDIPTLFEKGYIYLTADHELKCEVIANGKITFPQANYKPKK